MKDPRLQMTHLGLMWVWWGQQRAKPRLHVCVLRATGSESGVQFKD